MGDSDCMPCYEPVQVLHHRTRTNSTGTSHVVVASDHETVSHHHAQEHDGTITGPGAATLDCNGHLNQRKVEGGGNGVRGSQLSRGNSISGDAVDGSGTTVVGKSEGDHILLRKPLTPAVSEDHHDSDYDEISILPLSNQVSPLGWFGSFSYELCPKGKEERKSETE